MASFQTGTRPELKTWYSVTDSKESTYRQKKLKNVAWHSYYLLNHNCRRQRPVSPPYNSMVCQHSPITTWIFQDFFTSQTIQRFVSTLETTNRVFLVRCIFFHEMIVRVRIFENFVSGYSFSAHLIWRWASNAWPFWSISLGWACRNDFTGKFTKRKQDMNERNVPQNTVNNTSGAGTLHFNEYIFNYLCCLYILILPSNVRDAYCNLRIHFVYYTVFRESFSCTELYTVWDPSSCVFLF